MVARLSPKQVIALLLAAFVTVGFSFSVVQTGATSAKMAMMNGMSAAVWR